MKHQPLQGAPLGRRRTAKQIATILQDQRESGLSLLAFARQHQLCYSSLLRWRRRQRKVHRPAAATPAPGPAFIPIQIETGGWTSDHVLSWPAGRSLRIPAHFDSQTSRRLLEVLEERA